MDVFALNKTDYSNGEVINGIDNKLWIERYREPGEFKFVTSPHSDVREKLALGTLISHTDTLEVMMVEDHEIDEDKEEGAELIITGRSVTSFLDSRVVVFPGFGDTDPTSGDPQLYDLNLGNSWDQAVELIRLLFEVGLNPFSGADIIPNFNVRSTVTGVTETPQTERIVKRGAALPHVLSMLETSNIGIKVERPNSLHSTLDFVVHNGTVKTSTVRFSWDAGDVTKAKYFWTNRTARNTAYITAKYWGSVITPVGLTGWDIRMAYVDAIDIESDPVPMTSPELTTLDNQVKARGYEALGKMKTKTILEATISKNARNLFRRDYNVGDIVYVLGNYGVSAPMRVIEYAEIEDASGESGYPSVAPLP